MKEEIFKKIFNLAAETKKDKRVLLHKYSLPSLSLSLFLSPLLLRAKKRNDRKERSKS
jgi:hypothetical protein